MAILFAWWPYFFEIELAEVCLGLTLTPFNRVRVEPDMYRLTNQKKW